MKERFKRALAVAVIAVAAFGGSALVGVQPASAAYSDCPSGFHCFFSGSGGGGSRWQFAGNNSNISGYGIATRSGYNHGGSGMRHCGFEYTNYSTLRTSTLQGQKHSYSLRAVRSNIWTWGACSSI